MWSPPQRTSCTPVTAPQRDGTVVGALGSAPEHPRVEYVAGLESPAENFHHIAGALVKRGHSDADIRAVLGGNILRALEGIWPSPGI